MNDDLRFTLNAISSKDMIHRLVDELPHNATAVLVTLTPGDDGHYCIGIGRYAPKGGMIAVLLVGLMQTAVAWYAHKLFLGEEEDL